MDISTDFRRKMIIKLITALKESPSFCNISDNQLKEAVLNSEHQTFQQSKNKDEYLYHINEKLKKIKQSTAQRHEAQGIERSGDTVRHPVQNDDRTQIINGNIPSQIKISQAYSQDNPQNFSGMNRKLDSFSSGVDMHQQTHSFIDNANTEDGANMQSLPYTMADTSKIQTFMPQQHGQNGYPQYQSVDNQHTFGYQGFSPQSGSHDASKYTGFQNFQRRTYPYSSMQPVFRRSMYPSNKFQEQPSPKTDYIPGDKNEQYVGNNNYPYINDNSMNQDPRNIKIEQYKQQDYDKNEYTRFMGQKNNIYSANPSEINSNRQPITPFHHMDTKQQQYTGFFENDQDQKNLKQMFSSSVNRFKSDSYAGNFNTIQPIKRSDNIIPNVNTESDAAVSKEPISFEHQTYNPDAYSRNPQKSNIFKGNISSFEYTYNSSNRSFVGNINPGLLDHSNKRMRDSEILNIGIKSKTDKYLFERPFDDKKSEKLFKSFSEEFMKGNKVVNNNLDRNIASQHQITQKMADISNDDIDSSDGIDDEIPEELQLFLSRNNLLLKEIEDEEEWSKLFKNVYLKYKEIEHRNAFSFSEAIEMQNKFIFFPFIDEADLNGFLSKMQAIKQNVDYSLKISKEDYLDFIDKAIEAFSEKRKEESEFCINDGNEMNK